MYYASFGILSLILHTIINYRILNPGKGKKLPPAKERYKQFLLWVSVYYFSDIMWGILYERQFVTLAYADTMLYFTTMALSVFAWTRYVVLYLKKKGFFSKLLGIAGWIVLAYDVIALAINLFTPVMFRFGADKVYYPGDARYIGLGIQIALFLSTALYAFIIAAKTKGLIKRHYVTVGLSGLIMTIFIVLQSFYPFLPFYAIGCLIATSIVHVYVTENERQLYSRALGSAKHLAFTDPLTGVKNLHAYTRASESVNRRISDGTLSSFGIVVFDINGLKRMNDTFGHDAGDDYIKRACESICECFKHSPVFRIGGDEFAVILEGDDFRNRNEMLKSFNRRMDDNEKNGLVVISSGLAEYMPDRDIDCHSVFKRADYKMYDCKKHYRAMT